MVCVYQLSAVAFMVIRSNTGGMAIYMCQHTHVGKVRKRELELVAYRAARHSAVRRRRPGLAANETLCNTQSPTQYNLYPVPCTG